jgi:DNA-binding XRE family transcriptional regulator
VLQSEIVEDTMQLASQFFGSRLAAIRINRGLTQAELAALIGRTKQTICRWEHGGTAKIRASDVAKCARVLRCRRRALLASLDEPIPPPPQSWPRTRRHIKQHVAAAAGKRLRSHGRAPGAAAEIQATAFEHHLVAYAGRISKPPTPKPSAFDRALDLLLKLTADELIAPRSPLDRAGCRPIAR